MLHTFIVALLITTNSIGNTMSVMQMEHMEECKEVLKEQADLALRTGKTVSMSRDGTVLTADILEMKRCVETEIIEWFEG